MTQARPIIFSPWAIPLILSGAKTMTRRPMKDQPQIESKDDASWRDAKADLWRNRNQYERVCPFGQPGDHLWVRETFHAYKKYDGRYRVVYRASIPEGNLDCHYKPWTPSIHMKKSQSRITLEIASVRVERVSEISEEDLDAEGITLPKSELFPHTNRRDKLKRQFERLWDSLYGPGAWERNEFVWVLEFRRIEP